MFAVYEVLFAAHRPVAVLLCVIVVVIIIIRILGIFDGPASACRCGCRGNADRRWWQALLTAT